MNTAYAIKKVTESAKLQGWSVEASGEGTRFLMPRVLVLSAYETELVVCLNGSAYLGQIQAPHAPIADNEEFFSYELQNDATGRSTRYEAADTYKLLNSLQRRWKDAKALYEGRQKTREEQAARYNAEQAGLEEIGMLPDDVCVDLTPGRGWVVRLDADHLSLEQAKAIVAALRLTTENKPVKQRSLSPRYAARRIRELRAQA